MTQFCNPVLDYYSTYPALGYFDPALLGYMNDLILWVTWFTQKCGYFDPEVGCFSLFCWVIVIHVFFHPALGFLGFLFSVLQYQ